MLNGCRQYKNVINSVSWILLGFIFIQELTEDVHSNLSNSRCYGEALHADTHEELQSISQLLLESLLEVRDAREKDVFVAVVDDLTDRYTSKLDE